MLQMIAKCCVILQQIAVHVSDVRVNRDTVLTMLSSSARFGWAAECVASAAM